MQLIILFVFICTASILGQDIPPYKILGDRTIYLTGNQLSAGMEGTSTIQMIIDDKCNLLSFAILDIQITDINHKNTLSYYNDSLFEKITQRDTLIYKKQYYPCYIHFVFDAIYEKMQELKFVYSEDKKYLLELNRLGLRIIFK